MRVKRLLPLLLIAVSLAAPVQAQAQVQAEGDDWLTRASKAVRTSNYRGVLVYLREGQMDTLRIVHRYQDGNERERLVSLSGEPREIIRDNGVVTCVLPNKQVVLIARHAMESLLSNVADLVSEGLQDNYEIQNLGTERLADRNCRVVAVQPKDEYRYGYRLLIDTETHLPLKLELMRDTQVLEQMMFTDIEFPEHISDASLEATFDTTAFRLIKHQAAEASTTAGSVESEWRAAELPAGFRLAESGWGRYGTATLVYRWHCHGVRVYRRYWRRAFLCGRYDHGGSKCLWSRSGR